MRRTSATMSSLPVLNILKVQRRMTIFEQLRLEEALLRSDGRNWCLLNLGQEPPSIVMGISGVAEKLLNIEECKRRGTPVTRRFSGGGTVVVDSDTLFVSLIMNKTDVRGNPLYPREVMNWTAEHLYGPAFEALFSASPSHHRQDGQSVPLHLHSHSQAVPPPPPPAFTLNEHDYCLGARKFAGNAQAISRERFVHHTSILWSFKEENMRLLTLPEKRPAYRADRKHEDFLTPLKDHFRGISSSSSLSSSPFSRDAHTSAVEEGHEYHVGADILFPALLRQLCVGPQANFVAHDAPLEMAVEVAREAARTGKERIGTVPVVLS